MYRFAGEEFGQHRLMEVLNKHRQSSLETLLHSLQSTMHQWAGSTEFADDVTLPALGTWLTPRRETEENAEKAGGLL